MAGERGVAPARLAGDFAPEPVRGGERRGRIDAIGNSTSTRQRPPERAGEEVDLGGVLVDGNAVAGLLQAPFAGVPPEVFCFGEVEVDLDLGAVETVARRL